MENIKQIQRIFILVKFLLIKPFSLKELCDKFLEFSIKISKITLKKYIEILKKNDIKIEEIKEKNKTKYYIKSSPDKFQVNEEETNIFWEIKKILFSQKNYKVIHQIMCFCNTISDFIDDEDIRDDLSEFGYYCEINWYLLFSLEEHCLQKNIISLKYVKSKGGIEQIHFHAKKIEISQDTGRIYLVGKIVGDKYYSTLPIERILYIKNIVKKHLEFDEQKEYVIVKIIKTSKKIPKNDFLEYEYKEIGDFYIFKYPIENIFRITQKIMQLCPDVYYISDENIKKIVLEKLKTLKKIYVRKQK